MLYPRCFLRSPPLLHPLTTAIIQGWMISCLSAHRVSQLASEPSMNPIKLQGDHVPSLLNIAQQISLVYGVLSRLCTWDKVLCDPCSSRACLRPRVLPLRSCTLHPLAMLQTHWGSFRLHVGAKLLLTPQFSSKVIPSGTHSSESSQ